MFPFFFEKFSEMSRFFFFEKNSRHLDLDFVFVAIWKQFSLLLRWRNLPPFTPKSSWDACYRCKTRKLRKKNKHCTRQLVYQVYQLTLIHEDILLLDMNFVQNGLLEAGHLVAWYFGFKIYALVQVLNFFQFVCTNLVQVWRLMSFSYISLVSITTKMLMSMGARR